MMEKDLDLSAESDMEAQMKADLEEEEVRMKMKTKPESAKSRADKSPRAKTIPSKSDTSMHQGRKAKSSSKDQTSSFELSHLKDKAMHFVQKGGEELSHRYAHAFDDVKVVSKMVQNQLKDKPYQIAMSAVGVVGLGMVLAKRFNQRHDKPTQEAATHS